MWNGSGIGIDMSKQSVNHNSLVAHKRTTPTTSVKRKLNYIMGSISVLNQALGTRHHITYRGHTIMQRAFTVKPRVRVTPNHLGRLISLPPSDMPHESLGGCWGCGVCVGCECPLRLLAVFILHCMYMHDMLLNYLKLYDLSCLPKERYNLFDPFI